MIDSIGGRCTGGAGDETAFGRMGLFDPRLLMLLFVILELGSVVKVVFVLHAEPLIGELVILFKSGFLPLARHSEQSGSHLDVRKWVLCIT